MNTDIKQNVLMILLSFENELVTVNYIKIEDIDNGAYFIVAELIYPNHTMRIPLVYYLGENWIFTPCDWQQGNLPTTQSEIPIIEWRVNNTDKEGINFNGVPMLFT